MSDGQQYRLTRDTFYCGYFNSHPLTTTLKEGEVCEYFAHSDAYVFNGRESLEGARITPYYPRTVVESWPFWFEPVLVREKKVKEK